MTAYVAVVVAGLMDRRFVEMYYGGESIAVGPHHQYALFPTTCDFITNQDGKLEAVPGSEQDLAALDIGTVIAFDEARGRTDVRYWMGRCFGVQISNDFRILGKVELGAPHDHANVDRVRALLKEHGINRIQNSWDTFWSEAHADFRERYPEEWDAYLQQDHEKMMKRDAFEILAAS